MLRALVVVVVVAAAAAVGCGSSAGSHAGDIDLTINQRPGWQASDRASVTSLSVGARGASLELVGTTYSLTRAMLPSEHIIVHAGAAASTITLSAVASAKDHVLAVGSVTVKLAASGVTPAVIDLDVALADGYLPDDAHSAVPVSPASLVMLGGDEAQFTPLGPVDWSVREGSAGGTIDATGRYVAPAAAGTYHAVATSSLFWQQSSASTIAVQANGVVPWFGTPGGAGFLDGTGAGARIEPPYSGGHFTSDGTNLYLAQRHAIRRIDPATGTVTTIVGSPINFAYTAGNGTAAGFDFQPSIAADGNGHLYAGDAGRLLRIDTATADVTPLITSNGHVDGPLATAQVTGFYGMTWANGTLYFTEPQNCSLRMLDAGGTVTTLAGPPSGSPPNGGCGTFTPGTGTAARFCLPSDIAVVGDVVYMVDNCSGSTNLVRYHLAGGAVDQLTTLGTNGWGIAAQGSTLWTMEFGAALYRVDTTSGMLTKYLDALPEGRVTGFLPVGSGTTAYAVSFDALYSVDTSQSTNVRFIAGQGPLSAPPGGVVGFVYGYDRMSGAPDGNIYLCVGPQQFPIYELDTHALQFVPRTSALTGNSLCRVMAIDGGTVYTDSDGAIVSAALDGSGTMTTLVPAKAGQSVNNIALDGNQGLYIAYDSAFIVRLSLLDGTITPVAGTDHVGGGMDGTGAAAQFTTLNGMLFDGADTLWLADGAAIRNIKIPSNVVTTFAGDYSYAHSACTDGVGTAARFGDPHGMVLDGSRQNLYVADRLCNTIRKIALADGTVTTVAGTPGISALQPGALPAALSEPSDLMFAATGELLVSLQQEAVVVKIRF
jgi:hypothetical protein